MTQGKVVGLILDLSLRHENGVRVLDVVKRQLIRLVTETFEDDVDGLYLYHPDVVEVARTVGEQVGVIGNYETDGTRLNLLPAMQQCLYVLAVEDDDLRKQLFLITDRKPPVWPLEKAARLSRRFGAEVAVTAVCVGCKADGMEGVEVVELGGPDDIFRTLDR